MFKNVLVPISSEFYPKQVLKRSLFIGKKFKSKINFLYIIEEKNLDKTDKLVDSYISDFDINETKKQMIKTQKQTAENLVFKDANLVLNKNKINYTEKVKTGEFTPIIKKEIKKHKYDLILMGFEKECYLHYRLLEEVDIPVWIEAKSDSKKILSVCSNLAPNQKVPNISTELSEKLGWDLHMLYILDKEDTVIVDKKGKRSDKRDESDLIKESLGFYEYMKKKGIEIEVIKGKIEKETIKKAKKINANLVIVGREQKKKGMLGFPIKNLKRKLAEKCEYSLLFIN